MSKNRNGSFRKLHLSAKVVPVFASVEAGERCPVLILDRYIRRLPQEARDKDLFYVRPLERALPGDDTPWYSAVPRKAHSAAESEEAMRKCWCGWTQDKPQSEGIQCNSDGQCWNTEKAHTRKNWTSLTGRFTYLRKIK